MDKPLDIDEVFSFLGRLAFELNRSGQATKDLAQAGAIKDSRIRALELEIAKLREPST